MNTPALDTPYGRYLGLDHLFAVQGDAETLHHPDELQFRTVHLVSELWLRLVASEMERATALLEADALLLAHRLLDRAVQTAKLLVLQLELLNTMPLADYHTFRADLADASGLQSPGYRMMRSAAKSLYPAFDAALRRADCKLADVYQHYTDTAHGLLHNLAEALFDLDATLLRFLYGHLHIALRFLGDNTAGTGGQGVAYLRKALERPLFPALWQVRGEVSLRMGAQPYGTSSGDHP